MTGYFWIDKYRIILIITGWLSMLAALAFFVSAIVNRPFRADIMWIALNAGLPSLVMFLSGFGCLAISDLIEMWSEMRNDLSRLVKDIDDAKRRQAQRLNRAND